MAFKIKKRLCQKVTSAFIIDDDESVESVQKEQKDTAKPKKKKKKRRAVPKKMTPVSTSVKENMEEIIEAFQKQILQGNQDVNQEGCILITLAWNEWFTVGKKGNIEHHKIMESAIDEAERQQFRSSRVNLIMSY